MVQSGMIFFHNDYNKGAHPEILRALENTNTESYTGYGLDTWCRKGAQEIQKALGSGDAAIHFLTGGTQVNYTLIAAALRPFQSVIAADCSHINGHETGAVENTGHKILAYGNKDGKLTAEAVEAAAAAYAGSRTQEHVTQPKLVFLSFPSELGTVYSKSELEAIRRVCDSYRLFLYIDGARLGYGLAAGHGDVTLQDIFRCADAFTIGGTKCGALFGEALVLKHPALKENFRSYMKQNGAMLAKGWLLGLQFYTLFRGGLYFSITKNAVAQAMRIRDAFRAKGIPLQPDSPTNQQFAILTKEQADALAEKYTFEYEGDMGGGRQCVRFCTSWSTTDEEVSALVADIAGL